MKTTRKIIVPILASCMVLSSCNAQNPPSGSPTVSASETVVPSASSETTSGAPISSAPSSSPALTSSAQEHYTPPDYSNHKNLQESMYTTMLADPTKLKEGAPVFVRTEQVADWSFMTFEGFAEKNNIWGYDVRSRDISGFDLSAVENINDLSFNSDTVWPDTLPAGFDPQQLLEFNKNPGLGIRELHEQGITGDGVGIAIIDQALLLSHEQYKDNLMYYERIHCVDEGATMHGAAVSGIAVGKDIGTAPGAKLYYIASTFGHFTDTGYEFDASVMADCILRVLEINKELHQSEKIRVISISRGYGQYDQGYNALNEAILKASKENIFVVTTSTEVYSTLNLFGMCRDYGKDPDDPNSYTPAGWVADNFYSDPNNPFYSGLAQFPMGSRTYPSPTGDDKYELSYQGGLSWAVPWCAGFYALCCQVKPDITSKEFIKLVYETATTTTITHNGKTYKFGKIVNPAAVIERLKSN